MIPLPLHWQNNQSWGVGVSGGGDSMALLHLLVQKAGAGPWHAVLVNHGWNEAFAAQSQKTVESLCQKLNVPLTVIHAAGAKPATNAEAAGRKHRYAAFKKVCAQHNLAGMVLGHTRSDQVEQFLLRAAHGSGLTGLAGIPEHNTVEGVTVVRPLLHASRAELRAYLKQHKIRWVEDPSNPTSARGKIRQKLKGDWLPEAAVSASISALARAEEALQAHTHLLVEKFVTPGKNGASHLERDWLLAQPEELALRLLAALIKDDADSFAPRTTKRAALLQKIAKAEKGAATLGKAKIEWQKGALKIAPLTAPKN